MSIWDAKHGKFSPGMRRKDKLARAEARDTQDRTARENQDILNSISAQPSGLRDDFGTAIRLNRLFDNSAEDDEDGATPRKTYEEDGLELTDEERYRLQVKETAFDESGASRRGTLHVMALEPKAQRTAADSFGGKPPTTACCSSRGISWLGKLQGAMQAYVAPGTFCFAGSHSHTELWEFADTSPSICLIHAVQALSTCDRNGEKYILHTVDKVHNRMVVHAYTGCEWLDVLDISFSRFNPQKPQQFHERGCIAQVKAYSSGCCPVSCPGALCGSLACIWFPFQDRQLNKRRVNAVRAELVGILKFRVLI